MTLFPSSKKHILPFQGEYIKAEWEISPVGYVKATNRIKEILLQKPTYR